MLWHDEQVDDRKRLEIVVHQKQARIVAGGETRAFGLELAVQNLGAEFPFLALQFKLFVADSAEEIRERIVVGNDEIFALPQCGQ